MTEARKFEEIEIPVPWGHICGKWWGPRDKDPVIAIHGWQDNAGSFDNLAPLLPEGLALLCIDLPGHGFSSSLPPGQFYYLWWDNLVVLRRVILHLRLERVSLLGHSLGGAVGFLYAATYPNEVDKLVSIDIVAPRVEKPHTVVEQTNIYIDRFLKYDSMSPASVPCYSRETMLDIIYDAHQGSVSRENCEILLRRGMQPSPSDPQTFFFSRDSRLKIAGLAPFSRDHVMSYAEKVRCEYLNIRAAQGIKLPFPEMYDEVLDVIKKNAPRFEVHKLEGTHHIHLEDASVVAKIIGSFFTSEKAIPISQNHNDLVI